MKLALVNRRKIASGEAVPDRMAVAYLIIRWDVIGEQYDQIGRVSAGASRG